MKKIFFTVLSVFTLGNLSYAQTTSDILQLAQSQTIGTARFNALSGAFGALGGDLTALSENPAGSAVFLNSYGSITLGQGGGRSRSTYFGTVAEEEDATLDFNQIGGVLVLKNTSGTGPSKITLGLAYNKTNDFRDEFRISGRSPNSIADYFVGQANGLPTGALISNGRSDRGALLDFGFGETALRDQQAYFGFQSLLIDPVVDEDSNLVYQSNINGTGNLQDYIINTRGSSGKVSFNAAAEFYENLLLGVNFNVHYINRRREVSFLEDNDFLRFRYEIDQRTLGAGVSFNLGAIYTLNTNFKFGLSYETPTWLELTEEVEQFSATDFAVEQNINGELTSIRDIDPGAIFEFDSQNIRTPGTISGSIAYIIGKSGLISGQYSRKDFSNIEYTSNGTTFDELNAIIKNTFEAVNTYKIGGEYRYENWRFRGGLSKITSPYKNSRIEGDTDGFSLGMGYNWGKWKLDVAFNHIETDRVEAVFENANFNNTATINKKDDAVSVTLGVNF